MTVKLLETPFNPWEVLQQHEQQQAPHHQCGALATFIGKMRDFNADDSVTAMYLEHYPAMTERYLQQLDADARQRWEILDCMILHRVGRITPGDTIVLIAVWAAHRAHAFEACRQLIEDLKHQAPFWKQETLKDGSRRWVTENTPGTFAPRNL